MLRRAGVACAVVALFAGVAVAADDGKGGGASVRQPERLTVGVSDQYLGQLTPDGKTLVFVSNRNATTEIYTQHAEDPRPKLLFDEGADATWPRVSPDGKRILYVSFRHDAAGQLCVRDFPSGKPRCLADGSSALQAEWRDPGRAVLVSRGSVEGDLRLLDVTVGKRGLSARPLVLRSLTSPAVSPDGRWLVYVPVERYVERVGPGFAARAGRRLEALRLDRPGAAPVAFSLDLPGLSGQPAFSRDGKWLYVAQFVNDTNRDGVADGSDFALVFRVPWEGARDDAPARASTAAPQQLTDSSWNCQYPQPAADRLVLTCSRAADLDIYALPLDGMIPAEWSAERLRAEIDVSTRRFDLLLLYAHLLGRESQLTARRDVLMRLVWLYLEFDELDAADFFIARIANERDRATSGIASGLQALAAHRRAVRDRERGRISVEHAAEARRRFEALAPNPRLSAVGSAFRQVVRSEIADSLGDKEGARRELEAVHVADLTLASVVEAYADRADALYRSLDDREALVAAMRRLAEHPTLEADERLRYARAAVRALVRGLPYDEAEAILARARTTAPEGSELAFAVDSARLLNRVRDERPPRALREEIRALYNAQRRFDRQRALMTDAIARAVDMDAEQLVEALAADYLDDVPAGTRERRRAERLFERALLERAYRRLAAGRVARAREAFAEVARRTRSLEAAIGWIDVRIQEGAAPGALVTELGALLGERPAPAFERFARAYLLGRGLDALDGEAHARAAKEAIALLRGAWAELKSKREAQALMGALLHDEYLRERTMALAQRANSHYLVALDLVGRNARYRAMLLAQLGFLHAQVGNHRIALGYFEDREKLPFLDDEAALFHLLTKAQALAHVDKEAEAAKVAEEALALATRAKGLAPYRVLALDRAALYALAADRFERALQLYDEEVPLVDAMAPGADHERNRTVARLARAAAALGAGRPARALEDLAFVDGRLRDPAVQARLRWPHTAPEEVLRSYRLIAAGLRAKAARAVGDLAAAERALDARRGDIQLRYDRTRLDEQLRSLALVESQLADVARERGDIPGAVEWTRRALGHADAFARRTNIPLDTNQLDLLWFAAELRVATDTPLKLRLGRRMREAHELMTRERDPAWRSHQRWFEIYLGLLGASPRLRRAAAADGEGEGEAAAPVAAR